MAGELVHTAVSPPGCSCIIRVITLQFLYLYQNMVEVYIFFSRLLWRSATAT